MPSQIPLRLRDWIVEGTSEGPLWYYLYATTEEKLIGFSTGAVAGLVVGIALGRTNGTGLGLAIVKEIAEANESQCTLANASARGGLIATVTPGPFAGTTDR